MKVLRLILSPKLFETLNQDLIETLMKCNLEVQGSKQLESNHLAMQD
jgi:hypothetical protein